MSETFTTFITDAPTRTLDGTELVPLVTSIPDTEQNTLANIISYITTPTSVNLSYADNGNTLSVGPTIYYVTMSGDGDIGITLPASSATTNVILTFVTIYELDEGGLNINANGGDNIQGVGSTYNIPGSGGNVQLLSDGTGNWWVLNNYYA